MKQTPRQLGFKFPAEWERHTATWLSYPHRKKTWLGNIASIFAPYNLFIKEISLGEQVHINVVSSAMENRARHDLCAINVDLKKITFHRIPTNDAWIRDHGSAFIIASGTSSDKGVVNWDFNSWGHKYPCNRDALVSRRMARITKLRRFTPNIVMEGGSVDFNGAGTVLTTTSCLLNTNRNPHLSKSEIETFVRNYYGVEQILWLGKGLAGDDTDGHVDDITRFVSRDTVITMVEPDRYDTNHEPLADNLKRLKTMRLIDGKQLTVIEIPMPDAVVYNGKRLPASYANFYICNAAVIVPTFDCPQDRYALDTLRHCFKDRPVIGINSIDIIRGLGSFHCLSQQEPA